MDRGQLQSIDEGKTLYRPSKFRTLMYSLIGLSTGDSELRPFTDGPSFIFIPRLSVILPGETSSTRLLWMLSTMCQHSSIMIALYLNRQKFAQNPFHCHANTPWYTIDT